MSTQFENVKSQTSGIRAWGNLEQDTIVVQVRVSSGLDWRATKAGKRGVFYRGKPISDFVDNSDIGISDIYWKQDGEWLAKFGTIKSMCGLSNKEIGKLVQRLQETGKFSGEMDKSQWENVTIENGELIFVDDWKDVEPEEFVVEQTPENPEDFDSWLDTIIGIIGEVSDATPEQLRKLGAVLDTLGKELEETEGEESMEDILESDEEEERLASEIMEEIKKGNKHLIDFFGKIMETPGQVIETPVKPNESPIVNQIMQEAVEKDEKKYWKEIKGLEGELEEMKEIEKKLEYTPPSKTWGPNKKIYSKGEQEMTEQEIQQGQRRHKSFLDSIVDEMVFCEPMSWVETQKRWEKTWRDMGKEWQRHAMERRHKEQEKSSRWDLFNGLTGKTPPWAMLNPRDPEFWEPEF